jgi:SNF2 family DNA or RNA helicase
VLTPDLLHPYQRQAVEHIIDAPRDHLFADMGTGKTAATLTAFDALRLAGEARRMLVVAPLRVAQTVWPREPGKWTHLQHLTVQPILGTPKQRERALTTGADIYTINVENWIWLVDRLGKDWPFDLVVADESTRFKKPSGKRFRAAKRIHKLPSRWVNLTGTPSPNGLLDLWAPTYLLDHGQRLGKKFNAFKEWAFESDFMGYNWVPRPWAEDEIHARINDITLSIRAADHLDIREPVHHTVEVELPDKARAQYEAMEREMFLQLEAIGEDVDAMSAAALTMKLRQIASGAVYYDEDGRYEELHDAKLQALQSVVEEAGGSPILVAYIFQSTRDRLLRTFPQARVLDTDPATEDDWNAGRIPLLLAHPASCGHGLNLQDGGHHLAVVDQDWDLELYQQIIERIGPARQLQAGYDRPVYIHNLVARGTVDELVLARRETKRSTQDLLIEAMRRTA